LGKIADFAGAATPDSAAMKQLHITIEEDRESQSYPAQLYRERQHAFFGTNCRSFTTRGDITHFIGCKQTYRPPALGRRIIFYVKLAAFSR